MDHTHLGPRCFPPIPNKSVEPWRSLSRFCWALKPEGKIVIFVHGFGGDSIATWEQFVSLWPREYPGWDLASFGYPSYRFNVGEHAISFINFLNLILDAPVPTINSTLEHLISYRPDVKRESDFWFTQIVFIAHSMGAVVCRKALLQQQNSPWMSRAHLILFAPAHKGARPLMFFNALTSLRWGPVFGASLNFFIPALKDLREGSDTLEKLESATKDIGARDPFVASAVIHSMPDWTVVNDLYANDPTPRQEHDTSHTKVCKPSTDEDMPLTEVRNLLSRLPK